MGEINQGKDQIKRMTDENQKFQQMLEQLKTKTDKDAQDFKQEIQKLQRQL